MWRFQIFRKPPLLASKLEGLVIFLFEFRFVFPVWHFLLYFLFTLMGTIKLLRWQSHILSLRECKQVAKSYAFWQAPFLFTLMGTIYKLLRWQVIFWVLEYVSRWQSRIHFGKLLSTAQTVHCVCIIVVTRTVEENTLSIAAIFSFNGISTFQNSQKVANCPRTAGNIPVFHIYKQYR